MSCALSSPSSFDDLDGHYKDIPVSTCLSSLSSVLKPSSLPVPRASKEAGVDVFQECGQHSNAACSFIPDDTGGNEQLESRQMDEGLFDWDHVDPLEFNRLRRFLGQSAWAREYYDEDDGFHVVIRNIVEHEARQQVDEQKFFIPVIFVKPISRTYEQCLDVNPGDRLNAGQGLFSGTVGTHPQQLYGLTAAHAVNTDVVTRLSNGDVLSNIEGIIILDVHLNDPELPTTANVRLLPDLKADVRSTNEIHVMECMKNMPNGIYKPTVYRREVTKLRNKNIALRNNHGELLQGSIRNSDYTNVDINLFHTITVNGLSDGTTPIVEPGDCGALVWLIPAPGGCVANVVEVAGIVIGRLVHDETEELLGVVNNLHVVLTGCGVFGLGPNLPGFYDVT